MRFDDDDSPAMRECPPPDGVYALRCGVTCGRDSAHPHAVLTARTFAALDRKEYRWRCPTCDATAFGVRRPTVAGA